MPTLSGWNVLESIKSKKDLQQTKVFANSAESSFADNKHSNFQFDGILEKGFDPDNLAKIYYN
jgi:CheY-like chemotaxis protein